MTQTIYTGESLTKVADYVNANGIDLTAATVQVASGSYSVPATTWETPASVDRTNATTGTLTVSMVFDGTRPTGRQWMQIRVTLGASVDVFIVQDEAIDVQSGSGDLPLPATQGLPIGGAVGQVLEKSGTDDYAAAWINGATIPGVAPAKGARRELATRRTISIAASPPTLALSAANAATTISGSVLRAPSGVGVAGQAIDIAHDPNFSYLGTPSMAALTSTNAAYATQPNLTGSTSNQKYAPSIGWNFYGDKLEIVFKALVSHWEYRLRVDDQWVTEETTYLSGLTVGGVYRLLVTFSAVGNHRMQLDFAGNALGGVQALPTHSISRLRQSADIPTIALGDSVTASANSGTSAGSVRNDTWVNYTAQLLGWRNLYNVALASTGYSVAGTEAAFTTRTADYAIAGARVIVYGGLNDGPNLNTTLSAAIDTTLGAIAAAGPAEFIVLGWHPKTATDYANSTAIAVNALLASKAAQWGATFIDTLAVAWVTGTGTLASPNSTGNSDLFVNGDGIHPTRAGHQYLGRVYADAIAATYATLPA